MKRILPALAVLALIAAGIHGCTKERDSNPFGTGNGDGGEVDCLACHGDEEMLRELLPVEEGRAAVYTRGDG